jgi:predicted nucleic acid-binding protein
VTDVLPWYAATLTAVGVGLAVAYRRRRQAERRIADAIERGRAERVIASRMANAVNNARRQGRPCPTPDQLQAVLAEAIRQRNEQVIENFRRQLASIPEVSE